VAASRTIGSEGDGPPRGTGLSDV